MAKYLYDDTVDKAKDLSDLLIVITEGPKALKIKSSGDILHILDLIAHKVYDTNDEGSSEYSKHQSKGYIFY